MWLAGWWSAIQVLEEAGPERLREPRPADVPGDACAQLAAFHADLRDAETSDVSQPFLSPFGTLIVELKATSGYLGAVDQLVGYMKRFRLLGLAGGGLRGLLVADGFPPDVLAHAAEKRIDTATPTELGYRRVTWRLRSFRPESAAPCTPTTARRKTC